MTVWEKPMTTRGQVIGGAVALLLGPIFAGAGLAADVEVPTVTAPPVSSSIPMQRYGENNPKCLEWTDGCVVCRKDGCSNIGIACQPKDISCRDTLPKPDK
jgi:hypothetical protein